MPVWRSEWADGNVERGWTNDWTGLRPIDFWDTWVPIIAGVLALVTAAGISRGVRAWLLLVAGLLPFARAVFEGIDDKFGEYGHYVWLSRGFLAFITFVGAVAAAGSRHSSVLSTPRRGDLP